MKINRISPSSYNSWDGCQHKYFLEQNLKYTYPPGKAADIGTVTHKVLEILALIKLQEQEDPENRALKVKDTNIDVDDYSIDQLINIAISGFKEGYFVQKDLCDIRKYIDTALTFSDGEYDPRNRTIVAPEKRVKVEVPESWATLEDGSQFFLSGIIDLVTLTKGGAYEVVDWKGLPIDTKILTTRGWSTMGDLKIGDNVFDIDGKPTKVLAKSKQSYKECYKITFDDTSEAVCDYQHLWLLDDDSVVDAPNLKIGNKINLPKSLKYKTKDLPIDPYVLGIWLGDGRNRSAEITNADNFIFEEIERRGYKLGQNQEKRENKKASNRTIYKTTHELRKLNLLHNKHIPDIYLTSSTKQRLDLLRGLLDSDGHTNTVRKQAVFSNSHKNLIDDVRKLVLSLGQRPYLATLNNMNTNFKKDFTTYTLSFRPLGINPFLLPRKANKVINWGAGNSSKRRIKNIEKLPIELKTQCIKVDSPTSTFLCTENLIPTHNTGQPKDFNTGKVKDYRACMEDPQLRFYHWAASKIYGEDKEFLVSIFFLKTGTKYTIPFDPDDLPKTEYLLRERFEEIKACSHPKLNRSWKCKKFCPFGQKTTHGTNFPVMEQVATGGIAPRGAPMTICDCSNYHIHMYGIDFVQEHFAKYKK